MTRGASLTKNRAQRSLSVKRARTGNTKVFQGSTRKTSMKSPRASLTKKGLKRAQTGKLTVDLEKHLGLVHKQVSLQLRLLRLPQRHQLGDDLKSAGYEALVRARKNYKPKKAAFSTFATHHIKRAMQRALRRQELVRPGEKKIIAREKAGGARVKITGLEGVHGGSTTADQDRSEAKIRFGQLVKKAGIKGRDLKILKASAAHSRAQLAKQFGMSKTGVHKILKRIHTKMRKKEAA